MSSSHARLPMLQARQMLFDAFIELDRRVRKFRAKPRRKRAEANAWRRDGQLLSPYAASRN